MASKRTVKTTTPITDEALEESVDTQETKVEEPVKVVEVKKEPRKFEQNDPILCRSVTPGWMAVYGKSGIPYVFSNYGDECEIEYGDLFALKNKRSRYLYDPLLIIEDEELLEHPRWADVAKFYDEEVYGMDDINYVLNKQNTSFKNALQSLPKGLKKALTVEVAKRIENGTFDSMKKIKIIDEVCGTDLWTLMTGNDD